MFWINDPGVGTQWQSQAERRVRQWAFWRRASRPFRGSAKAFVRHRPREARLAVTAALEAAAAQCEADETGAGPDVPERLRQFIVRRTVGDEIVGVSEAAARLEVSRTTVYDWVRRNTLLAWRSTKRGLRIPAAQILGPGRVVPGLGRRRRYHRGLRTGVGVSHPGMAIRGCGRASPRIAQGGPHGRGDRRGARFRRQLLVSAARYPRDRIEPVPAGGEVSGKLPDHAEALPGDAVGHPSRGFPVLLAERGLLRPLRQSRICNRLH